RCQLLHQHAQGGLRTLGRGRKIIGNVEPDLDRVSWDGDFDRQASASAGQPDRVVLVQSRENIGVPDLPPRLRIDAVVFGELDPVLIPDVNAVGPRLLVPRRHGAMHLGRVVVAFAEQHLGRAPATLPETVQILRHDLAGRAGGEFRIRLDGQPVVPSAARARHNHGVHDLLPYPRGHFHAFTSRFVQIERHPHREM
ncbi:MAG: hypothetical protein VYB08_05270, partial [Candidatus Latescibacterota bacterium]|nr:hypothetical protein [Candidatus Latescibacterota bacterium]